MAVIQLWDPFVRIFHWTIAVVFLANYFINDKGEAAHIALGYLAMALLVMRVIWGFMSSGAARWSAVVPTRVAVRKHLQALVRGNPYRRLGHTPLGSIVMMTMMACLAGLGVTGVMMTRTDTFWGVEWVKDLHWLVATLLLCLVCLHVLAAVYESWKLRENLPWSMITGRRRAK
ncbi:MAG: cytochrome b/b6 domain-containing protein [Alcanivoracaceae bacterium]